MQNFRVEIITPKQNDDFFRLKHTFAFIRATNPRVAIDKAFKRLNQKQDPKLGTINGKEVVMLEPGETVDVHMHRLTDNEIQLLKNKGGN